MICRTLSITFAFTLLSSGLPAQVTTRADLSTGGTQANGNSSFPAITPDGRFIAFLSQASNLVAGDTNGQRDVFLHDRIAGTTERISVGPGGVQGLGDSATPALTPDGRYVVFSSTSSNLVAGDTNGVYDVFLRDRLLGTIERVSVGPGGEQGNGMSGTPAVSDDGRYVAFESEASNFFAPDANGAADIFVKDRQTGALQLVSISVTGATGNAYSAWPTISADGRHVAFFALAGNLVAGDSTANADVFVRDLWTGATELVDVSSAGVPGNHGADHASISASGRYVSFSSPSTNLVANDSNGWPDLFVRDRESGTTERVSVSTSGTQGNAACDRGWISRDGRHVAFHSLASNLVSGDSNARQDAFVHDCDTGVTERVSVSTAGAQGNDASGWFKIGISDDGRFVAFESSANNLVDGDAGGWGVFVRDRSATGFASLCDPGTAEVLACACDNPPSGSGRGCNNSAGTGGAVLSATGAAYLSMDSLAFSTAGENPTALSLVLQGNGLVAGGVVYGQGIRCAGGTILRRLFAKAASGGAITAPNASAGDPTVAQRSAALGDTIHPGESRYYLVYYRDPVVLGGCPASSTFNATQTASVSWSP